MRGTLLALLFVFPSLVPAAAPPVVSRLTPAEIKALEAKHTSHYQAGVQAVNRFDLPRASAEFESALKISQRQYPTELYPEGHLRLARDLSNLANIRQRQSRWGEAEVLHRQSVAMVRKLFPHEKNPEGHADMVFALNNLALLLRDTSRAAEAEPVAREALAIRRRVYPVSKFPKGELNLANSINTLGFVLSLQDKHAEAERLFREALITYRLFGNQHPGLVRALLNLGRAIFDQGRPTEAEAVFVEAVETCRRVWPVGRAPAGDPLFASTLVDASRVLAAAGKEVEAERLLREALDMVSKLYPATVFPDGHPEYHKTVRAYGLLLMQHGKWVEAERAFRESLRLSRHLYPPEYFPQGHRELLADLTNLVILFGDRAQYAEAERLAREAEEMVDQLYPPKKVRPGQPDRIAVLVNLGTIFAGQERPARAEAFFRRAFEESKAIRTQRGSDAEKWRYLCPMNYGANLRTLGKTEEAERVLRDALDEARRAFPRERYPAGHPYLATATFNLALASRDGADRLRLYRDALAMYAALVEQHAERTSEGESLAYLSRMIQVRDSMIAIMQRGGVRADIVYPDHVWNWRGLVARTADRRRMAARAAASRAETAELLKQLTSLRRRRGDLLLAAAPGDPETNRKREDDLKTLTKDIEAAEKTIFPLLPALSQGEKLARATPADLQKALPRDTALIDYFSYAPNPIGAAAQDRRYLAFVITRDSLHSVDLGDAGVIDEAITRWRRAISRGGEGLEAGAAVRELVWAKVRKELPAATRTVYIVPDLGLTRLPWAALPGDEAGSILLENYALAVVPNGHFLLEHLWSPEPKERRPATMLVVGGVAFHDKPATGGEPSESLPALTRGRGMTWEALPGAEVEARGVAGLAKRSKIDSHLVTGKEATVEKVADQLASTRYAHLATHGFFADASFRSVLQVNPKLFETGGGQRIGAGALNPLVLSGLVMAGANHPQTPSRGLLTGEALVDRDLTALELAVLSACETGLGDVAGGEGVLGLQRAFHAAGCRQVVASLWKVDDGATAALMQRFYHHLLEKKLPAIEALRQAQLELYRNPSRVTEWARGLRAMEREAPVPERAKHLPPLYWSGFVLSGAGK